MDTEKPRVALLIDGDNALLEHIAKLVRFAHKNGTVTVASAYGDWKTRPLSRWKQKVADAGVTTEQRNRTRKNATDKQLINRAKNLLKKDAADVFVIASGDGDFAPVCREIRKKEKTVIVVGVQRHTSKVLLQAASKFVAYERL
ncbi:MAG: NYN domain-containing protein [Chloroflexota bacterium]